MAHRSFAEASRIIWGVNDGRAMTRDDLRFGLELRIADATEKMAGNFTALQNSRDHLERRRGELVKENERMARSIRALRGVINRMKRKTA